MIIDSKIFIFLLDYDIYAMYSFTKCVKLFRMTIINSSVQNSKNIPSIKETKMKNK